MTNFPIIRAFISSKDRVAGGDRGDFEVAFDAAANALGDLRDYWVKVEFHDCVNDTSTAEPLYIECPTMYQDNSIDSRSKRPCSIIAPVLLAGGNFPTEYIPINNSSMLKGNIRLRVTLSNGTKHVPGQEWGVMLILKHKTDIM